MSYPDTLRIYGFLLNHFLTKKSFTISATFRIKPAPSIRLTKTLLIYPLPPFLSITILCYIPLPNILCFSALTHSNFLNVSMLSSLWVFVYDIFCNSLKFHPFFNQLAPPPRFSGESSIFWERLRNSSSLWAASC